MPRDVSPENKNAPRRHSPLATSQSRREFVRRSGVAATLAAAQGLAPMIFAGCTSGHLRMLDINKPQSGDSSGGRVQSIALLFGAVRRE